MPHLSAVQSKEDIPSIYQGTPIERLFEFQNFNAALVPCDRAEEHFFQFAPLFKIGNETDFVLNESKRLNARYPKISVVPFYYKLDDNLLYVINE